MTSTTPPPNAPGVACALATSTGTRAAPRCRESPAPCARTTAGAGMRANETMKLAIIESVDATATSAPSCESGATHAGCG